MSDSHGTAGAAVAVSRLRSALAIAMMVGGSGMPPWPCALHRGIVVLKYDTLGAKLLKS